jgi:DNA-binding NtrC family response regulator
VLIEGEEGTGKLSLARRIHELSRRRSGRFVQVECAELSARELAARLEWARGGTLLLEEVDDLSPELQAELHRVLTRGSFPGAGEGRKVIATSSRALFASVQRGRFRQDLYFQLQRLEITPLRERSADLPALVQWGLRTLGATLGVSAPRTSYSFHARIGQHPWPGNLLELSTVLERVLLERRVDVLQGDDLEGLLAEGTPGVEVGDQAASLREALREARGNRSRAARLLGITRSRLRQRLRLHGLPTED